MNEKFLTERLIPALKDGSYKQGRKRLRGNDGEHCCLGVMCDLVTKEKILPGYKWSNNSTGFAVLVSDSEDDRKSEAWGFSQGDLIFDVMLPRGIAEYIGINEEGDFRKPVQIDGTSYTSLMDMNDGGVSFEVIADTIADCITLDNFVTVPDIE